MPLHVLCTFFVLYIIKGSAYGSYTAYGSYSLRTVFASIVLRSLVLRSVWSSFVESFGLFVLRGELCFVFGSICAIIGLFRSQGRTLLRVWIDLCDYWTVPFSGENFASCLDRFVRLLTAVPFSGENFASCLDRFVRLLTTIWFSGENFASCYLDRFVIIIDNYFVLRENIASWFALNFV